MHHAHITSTKKLLKPNSQVGPFNSQTRYATLFTSAYAVQNHAPVGVTWPPIILTCESGNHGNQPVQDLCTEWRKSVLFSWLK